MSAESRFTLRDLPLPAKLVVTCFLLAVGLGYGAAMVQLHFRDSKSGQPMPTVEDVILKFTGKKWLETNPPEPTSQFVKLLEAEPGKPFNGSGTMYPAFTTRDGGELAKAIKENPALEAQLRAQRDGERDALVLWAKSPPTARKQAYEADHFVVEAGKEPRALTDRFKIAGGGVRVRSVIEARCVRCHAKDGDDSSAANYPLDSLAHVEKYLAVPATIQVKPGGEWVKVEEPMSLDKLTQSTHAHLLSFAVLFSLTGLVFAFTSYPTVVRCVLGPWVLVAIVTDVIFWWAARLSDGYGVYFAMGVLGTGGAVGLGLSAQIVLSLWNMYGPKGKVAILLVFALAGAATWLLFTNVIKPGLDAKKAAAVANNGPEPKSEGGGKPDVVQKKENGPKTPPAGVSAVRRVLGWPKGPDGKEPAWHELKWGAEHEGGMARAFFDKDQGEFTQAKKDKDEETMAKLAPERRSQLQALAAWAALAEPDRKRAYDADAFDLPKEHAGKPFPGAFLDKNGKVKVQSVLTDHCFSCHAGEEKATFSDYASLLPYLEPKPAKK